MFIIDGLKWILTAIGTLYCYIVYTLALAGVVVFFVASIVAIVCYGPEEGGEEDADQQQTERRTF